MYAYIKDIYKHIIFLQETRDVCLCILYTFYVPIKLAFKNNDRKRFQRIYAKR